MKERINVKMRSILFSVSSILYFKVIWIDETQVITEW